MSYKALDIFEWDSKNAILEEDQKDLDASTYVKTRSQWVFVGENKNLEGGLTLPKRTYHANCERVLTNNGIRAQDISPLRVWVRHMCEPRVPHRLSEHPGLGS